MHMARPSFDPRIRNRIGEHRQRLGLSQNGLAKALNVYPNVITELERNESYASRRTLADLCELFHCQPGDLYYKVTSDEAALLSAK